jgi:hypothetical protein
MKDKSLPKSVGEGPSAPLYFSRKEDLCQRLDQFYESSNISFDIAPSDMFRSALFVMGRENRDKNPDWMAQAAHSLREILYQFEGDWQSALMKYGPTYDKSKHEGKVGQYLGLMSAIAHHNHTEAGTNPIIGGNRNNPVNVTPEVFEDAVLKFGDILFIALRRQVHAHQEIDEMLKRSPEETSANQARELVNLNLDAHQYFYAQADERWLNWLWQNGFLDIIKRKTEDPTHYGYKSPELYYLVKVAEKKPGEVVEIINSVPISEDNLNPEVIDQFLRICGDLPAEHLKSVVPKIQEDNWVKLMNGLDRWGFEYRDMLETLIKAKDYDSVLKLARTLLTVRAKEEIESSNLLDDNPFYLDNVSDTGIFAHLASLGDEHQERVFDLTLSVASQIISLGDKAEEDSIFEIDDRYRLYEVDFFELKPTHGKPYPRENVKQLFAVIKVSAERLIGNQCNHPEKVRDLYSCCVASLPNSRVAWRLRLFILSLCPRVFRDELKDIFFKLFETAKFHEITSGTEYKWALRACFKALPEEDRRSYVGQAISYFSQLTEEAKNKDEKDTYLEFGSRILSMIIPYLTNKEKKEIKEKGFTLKPNYKPETIIGPIRAGFVRPRGPISQEDFDELPIDTIAERLKNEWSPEQLYKEYKNDDSLSPRNADGTATLLKHSIAARTQSFVDKAELFFERGALSPHYTHAYFQGIRETLKENREIHTNINWDSLIRLMLEIKSSGEEEAFPSTEDGEETAGTWLARWGAVHSAMTDVLAELLTEQDGRTLINFSVYRDRLLKILEYLLSHPDPAPQDEEPKTASRTVVRAGTKKSKVSDPFSMAINSVRGRAFQTFVLFVYQDGKKLKDDVKRLYKTIIEREKTRALSFMFGYYLPTFYYRDKNWTRTLLPRLFPNQAKKEHLYLAAWEGYLTNKLYEEIFFDPAIQKLYERALKEVADVKNREAHREYFKDPEEALAVHLALAHMYYQKFGRNHRLFKLFWDGGTAKQHAAFISLLGRMFISEDNKSADELVQKEPWPRKRLEDVWTDLLAADTSRVVFEEFGSWMSLEKGIFEPEWLAARARDTLEKTKGKLKRHYELVRSSAELAEANPTATFMVAKLYLLNLIREKAYLHLEDKWIETLATLHNNPETKTETEALVNQLVENGGRPFWRFKDVL